MRVLFVLSIVLSVSTPQVTWVAAIQVSARDSGSLALGSSSTAASQINRAVTKVDKTGAGFGAAIVPAGATILAPTGASERAPLRAGDPPNLDLEGPPLAPRPPPLS